MTKRINLIAAAALLLGACNHKAEGQTVAVVNGQEITLSELNFELGIANLPEGADKNAARSQVLQSMVDRRLLAGQAKEEGVDTTPDFVNRKRRAEEDLLISMLSMRRLKSITLPTARESDAFIASHPAMFANHQFWELDQVQYQAPSDLAIQSEIDKAHSFADLLGILQRHGVAIMRQKNRLDTGVVPAELFQKISALPDGEPFIVRVGDRAIASVITARQPQPIVGDKARPIAANELRKEQGAKDMAKRVEGLRKAAKIEYKPGFAPKK